MPLPVIPGFAADGNFNDPQQDSAIPIDETPKALNSPSENEQSSAGPSTEIQSSPSKGVTNSTASDQNSGNSVGNVPSSNPDDIAETIAETISESESNGDSNVIGQSDETTQQATTLAPADSPNSTEKVSTAISGVGSAKSLGA